MQSPFMRRAIELSLENVRSGNGGPFGAVVVKDGAIIAEGANQVTSANDPTAHAEIVAIRRACRLLNHFHLTGCEIYSSCEPCPMCLGAIYWSRPDRVYFAATREDAARAGFSDRQIYEEIASAVAERKIPAIQMMRDEALPAFREWDRKADRVEY